MEKNAKTIILIIIALVVIGGIVVAASTSKAPIEYVVDQNATSTIDYGSDFNGDGVDEPGFESGNEKADLPNTYTLAQVSTHASATDCWSVIDGNVYNLTSFVGKHPGGDDILKICGKDGTSLFMGQHGGGKQQEKILTTLKVGTLAK